MPFSARLASARLRRRACLIMRTRISRAPGCWQVVAFGRLSMRNSTLWLREGVKEGQEEGKLSEARNGVMEALDARFDRAADASPGCRIH